MDYIERTKSFNRTKDLTARASRSLGDLVKRLTKAGKQSSEVPDSLDSQSLRQLKLMKGPRAGLREKR